MREKGVIAERELGAGKAVFGIEKPEKEEKNQ